MADKREERRMLILTREEFNHDWLYPPTERFDSLPLAPSHTDAEYDELKAKYDRLEAGRSLNAITRIIEGEHVEEWMLRLKVPNGAVKLSLYWMDVNGYTSTINGKDLLVDVKDLEPAPLPAEHIRTAFRYYHDENGNAGAAMGLGFAFPWLRKEWGLEPFHSQDDQEERHHTDAEYDELKAKLDETESWKKYEDERSEEGKKALHNFFEMPEVKQLIAKAEVNPKPVNKRVQARAIQRAAEDVMEFAEYALEQRDKMMTAWNEAELKVERLRAEVGRLKKDAPPLIYNSNAKMWILAGAVLLRNQAGDLLGIVRASDYYEKDREKK